MNRTQEVQTSENDIIQLVLKYLKEKQFYKAYLSLEYEAKISLENYPKEIQFFRQLILDGNFEETERFITIFLEQFPQKYREILYELKKQNFIELVLMEPEAELLIELLKDIEALTSKENYKNLFCLLTLKNIHSHPLYQDWSYEKSRFQCFQTILPIIESMTYQYSINEGVNLSLQQLFERLMYHETRNISIQNGSKVSLVSENQPISMDHRQQFQLKINPHIEQLDQSRILNQNNNLSFVNSPSNNLMKSQSQAQQQNLIQSMQFPRNMNQRLGSITTQNSNPSGFNSAAKNNNNSNILNNQSSLQNSQAQQNIQDLVNENMFFMQQSMHLKKEEFSNSISQKQSYLDQQQSQLHQQQQAKNKFQSQSQQINPLNIYNSNQQQQQSKSYIMGQGTGQLSNKNEQQFEPIMFYDTQKISARKEKSEQFSQQQQLSQNFDIDNNPSTVSLGQNSQYMNSPQQMKVQQQQQSQHSSSFQQKSSHLQYHNKAKLSQTMKNTSNQNQQMSTQQLQQQSWTQHQQLQMTQQSQQQSQQLQQNQSHLDQFMAENEDELLESPPQSVKYNKKKLAFHNRCFSFDSGFKKNSSAIQNNLSQKQKQQQPQFIQDNQLSQSHRLNRRLKNKSAVYINEYQRFGLNNISEQSNSSQERSSDMYNQKSVRRCGPSNQEIPEQNNNNNTQNKEVIIENLDLVNNSTSNYNNTLEDTFAKPHQPIEHNLQKQQLQQQQQQQSQFISFNPNSNIQQQQQQQQQQQNNNSAMNNNYMDNFSLQGSNLQESQSYVFQQNQSQQFKNNNNNQQENDVLNYDFSDLSEIAIIKDVQPIRTSAFSADGEYFVIGTNSKSLKLYGLSSLLESQQVKQSLESSQAGSDVNLIFEKKNHHPGSIYTVDWSRSSRLIATGSNDKSIKVLSIQDGDVEALQGYNSSDLITECRLIGHRGIVRTLQINQEETSIYSAGTIDNHIKAWDISTQKVKSTLEGHSDSIYSIQLGGEGNILASAGLDKKLYIWDLRANKPMITINADRYAAINSISLSESMNNTFLNQIMKNSKKGNTSNISQLQQKNQIVAAHQDGKVTYWDLKSQKLIQEIVVHESDCRSVEFDPTANYVATASFDGTVGIYDIQRNQIANQIYNHSDRVVQARFHPYYPFILTTSADCTSRVFAPKSFLINYLNNESCAQ